MPLTPQQIRALRAEAHRLKLKPVVMVGQHGLSDNVMNEVEIALDHHELIKLRIPAVDKEEKDALIRGLTEPTGAELIQRIGHVVVLFRKNPKSARFLKQLKGA